MRRTINGIVYDTDTATQIAHGDHDHPSSNAFWALYKKENGSFFELVVDHDGVPEGIFPLSKRQARVWLERHANHLVEEHFGPGSEIASPRFSRASRMAAIDVLALAFTTYSTQKSLMLKLGADVAAACDDGNLQDRYNALATYLDEDETRRTDRYEFLQDTIVEAAVARLAAWEFGGPQGYEEARADLVRQLSLDGFAITEGKIRSALPEELGLPDTQDEIDRLLVEHGFTTAKGHLDQARAAHARRDWSAANSMLRSFVEAVLDTIADRLDPGAVPSRNGSARGDRLVKAGFLDRQLGEWSDDGKNFTNGLLKRLHSGGSTPACRTRRTARSASTSFS